MQRKFLLMLLLASVTFVSFNRTSTVPKPTCGPYINIVNNSNEVIRNVTVQDDYGTNVYQNINIQPGNNFFVGQFGGTHFFIKLLFTGGFLGSITVLEGSNTILCQNDDGIANINFTATSCFVYDVVAYDDVCLSKK